MSVQNHVVWDCRLGRISVVIVSGDYRPIWIVDYDRWRDEEWEGEGYPRPIREGAFEPSSPVLGRFNEKDLRAFVGPNWGETSAGGWHALREIDHGLAVLRGEVSA